MVIGIVEIHISIPHARSLKDKRAVVRSLKDRAVGRMNVSVAEVGDQDLWQSARLAFVTVAGTSDVAQQRIAQISTFVRGDPRYVLLDLRTSMM